jgi:hypothetical protein
VSATSDSIAPQARLQVVIDELRESAVACRPDVRKALEGHAWFLENMAEEPEAEAGQLAGEHAEQAIYHSEVGAGLVPVSELAAAIGSHVLLLQRLVDSDHTA